MFLISAVVLKNTSLLYSREYSLAEEGVCQQWTAAGAAHVVVPASICQASAQQLQTGPVRVSMMLYSETGYDNFHLSALQI